MPDRSILTILAVWAQNGRKSREPQLSMVENDARSILNVKRQILRVSWQPGLRMIENDAKFIDSERLLAAWAHNGQK